MAKLDSTWFHAFSGCFESDEDVIEFIMERLNTSDFEDSYIDVGGHGDINEKMVYTKEEKRTMLSDYLYNLIERAEKVKNEEVVK